MKQKKTSVKVIRTGRKTDQSDSEWLASLLRSGLVKPIYVPEKQIRELRELTRVRVKLVGARILLLKTVAIKC